MWGRGGQVDMDSKTPHCLPLKSSSVTMHDEVDCEIIPANESLAKLVKLVNETLDAIEWLDHLAKKTRQNEPC